MGASWPGDQKRRRNEGSHRPRVLTARNVAAISRLFGLFFGVATHVLFAFTVWHLFWFLKGPLPEEVRMSPVGLGASLGIDTLLAL